MSNLPRSLLWAACLAALPAWNLAAQRPILFEAPAADGKPDIYAVNPDGSDFRVIAPHAAIDGQPSWSFDGAMIVFSSNRSGKFELFLSDPQGVDVRLLSVPPPSPSASFGDPDLSPDGTIVAFHVIDGDTRDVWTAKSDGSSPHNLTQGNGRSTRPDWAPDGRSIVFESDRDGEKTLYRMAADGTHVQRLTPGGHPAWSPDGSLLAYSFRGNVFVVEPTGDHPRVVVNSGAQPFWSPDGKRLGFARRDGVRISIYTAAPDGSDQQLVPLPYDKVNHPSW